MQQVNVQKGFSDESIKNYNIVLLSFLASVAAYVTVTN